MSSITQATEILELDEKWLQPFDVDDSFSGLNLQGYLSLKPDYRYGALALLQVDGRNAPQRILGAPKLHYPFNKNGEFLFPPIRQIDIYEKLDGTNVVAYRFRDADGNAHVTYKLRLYPILRNGNWGAFLDMWREVLDRYPAIADLPEKNECSVSFELYGSRNLHLMVYETALDCSLLFGIDADGECRPPHELETLDVPAPKHYGRLQAGEDPVAAYNRIRAEIQAEIKPQDDDKLAGAEGTVWYVCTATKETLLFKCKPESVEAIHWKGGISKEGVTATCWNLLETEDSITFESLERLLLEEYTPAEIERFRAHIDQCIADVTEQLEFRNRVLAAYAQTGLKISEDKATVMRALSSQFSRSEMKKVYSMIARFA